MRENCESWWTVWHGKFSLFTTPCAALTEAVIFGWLLHAIHCTAFTSLPLIHMLMSIFIPSSSIHTQEIIINYIMIHSSWFPASCIWSLFVPYLGTLWSLFPFSALFVVSHGFAPLRCNAFAFGHGWAGVGSIKTFNDLSRPHPQKVAFWASHGIPSKWRCCSLGTIRVSHRL